jgi:tRNA dimethylallyltransferase
VRCVGCWVDLAVLSLVQGDEAHNLWMINGGTGLYFKALCEGIAPIPDIDPEFREQASALYDRVGGEAFHVLLGERDPDAAARLDAGNRQRLIRAWEVIEATGEPLSAWQARPPTPPIVNVPDSLRFSLVPPRDWIYSRVEARFDAMMAAGALNEVEALLGRNLSPDLPVMKALGVPELAAHLADQTTLEEAVDKAKTATRRYAKRQMTWFRNQMADWQKLEGPDDTQDSESIYKEIFTIICQNGLTE